MRECSSRATADTRNDVVVLPADGATVARSLSGGLVLVAHTGEAHLGLEVSRALLNTVRHLRAALSPGPDERDARPGAEPPETIRFRHATSYTLRVVDGEPHLTLQATGDPRKPDVQVQLRVGRPLLDQLAQHGVRRRNTDRVLALVGLLVVVCACISSIAVRL